MARINIDDQFWLELMGVVAQLGDQDKAIGQAVRFFRMAQDKHKHGKLITEEEFKRAGFSEALIGTFADRVDGGIRAIGAQKHFGWLTSRVEAGRKGGQAKSSKPKQTQAKPSKAKQPEASYSSSSSFSSSPSHLVPTEPTAGGAAKDFIAAYCERFKSRWGNNPPIQPKDAGIAGRLAKGLSREKQDLYLDAYFSMPDAWLVKAKHPINLFETKLNEISVFAQSGQFHTQRQVRDADNSATNAMLLAKVERGEA